MIDRPLLGVSSLIGVATDEGPVVVEPLRVASNFFEGLVDNIRAKSLGKYAPASRIARLLDDLLPQSPMAGEDWGNQVVFIGMLADDVLDMIRRRAATEIPQNRERLYMAALSWDHFRTNVFHFPDPDPATIDYRTYLDLDQKAEDSFYFNDDSQYKKLFEESIDAGDADSIYMLRRNYVRENKSNTVFALMANMGDGGHNVPVIQDTWGIRKLTPAECLRLQGFAKDQFSFPNQVSRIQQYRQIGNAVTVPLVQKLAAECRRLLDERNGK